ncbi:MAG: AAA family ATPase [Burkholderiales bacterium]
MINNLKIEGYRGFQCFEMGGLSRINLLVGTNNSGKTSALEALYLLVTNSDPQTLWKICQNRGELRISEQIPQRPMQPELELGHLFNGHKISLGNYFQITASNSDPTRTTILKITEAKIEDNPQLFLMALNEDPDQVGARLALSIQNGSDRIASIPITQRGSINQGAINVLTNMIANQPGNALQAPLINVQYVSNASLTFPELNSSWGSIVLTEDENRVVRALQNLDSDIARIAAINSPFFGIQQRGGFVIKMRNVDQPIPIGSLGDGVWRMLALAIALIRSRNGILIVDEIDTGLHYSVMNSLWKMLIETSKAFNVQIFATTHSNDCIRALASIDEDEISIHRIEPKKSHSVQYSADEIRAAAEHNIEVR